MEKNYLFEIWKDINGYEGLYMVSNFGRVKSLSRTVEYYNGRHYYESKILKPTVGNHGYYNVSLCKDKKWKHHLVHRLVAEAFLPNPNGYKQVNHKDENKLNNHVDNLEWCTQQYNLAYGTGKKRMIEKHYHILLQYSLDGVFVKQWNSAREAERSFGNGKGHISRCCNGKEKQAYGYIWKYAS